MSQHKGPEIRGEPRRVRVKPWWLIVAAVCLLGGLILSLAVFDSAAYHWRQFEWLKTRGKAITHPNLFEEAEQSLLGNVSDRLYAHVNALEDLGEVNAHVFRAKYFNTSSRIGLDFNRMSKWHRSLKQGRLSGEVLASRGLVQPMGTGSQITMTVWCRPEFSEKWENLAAEFDARRNDFDWLAEETE